MQQKMEQENNFLSEMANQLIKTCAEIGSQALKSSKPWIELNNFYWNSSYEKTLGNLTQVPALGPSRGFQHKLMQAFDAWAQLYPANIDYQIVLSEIQIQSFAELLRELLSLAKQGEAIEDFSQLQQLWSFTADKVYEKTFCSEDKLKVRGRFLNAVNQYKLCQQELIEMWMETMNLPIRSEVDEIHKNIYELRKEVKSLKRILQETKNHAVSEDANGA